MKKLMIYGIILLTILGCSANNQWVKIDHSEFTTVELDKALRYCKFKEAMKNSNITILNSSNSIESSTEDERLRSRNDRSIKANNESKQKSMHLASQAYKCVKDKGFVKNNITSP